jgi:translation initiation factor 2B subunit (eIF-2B alpha/beta/delta family)
MPDTPANNELLSKILERLDQLDQKFTGEIRQLDEKFSGEIQTARKEAREFHNASKESFGHLQRVVENAVQKVTSHIEYSRQEWKEHQRLALEIWNGIQRTMQKDDRRMLNDEEILARLEKEIEELKKDKLAKDTIIAEFAKDRLAKDATILDLQQRISKLEASQNFAN